MAQINKRMLLAAWSVNNPYWIINQAYHIPLRKIFREVKDFDPQEVTYKQGKEHMNKQFLNLLKSYKPDYIMLFLVGDEFYPETLVKIKEILPNVIVVQWNGDDDIKFENYTVPYSLAIDYQLISQLNFTPKYDEYRLPWFDLLGVDINKFRPLNLKKKYDIVFVGTPKGDRLKYMRYLLKKNVNFVLGGAGWDEYSEFKKHYIGKLADEEFIKVINETKINLCFSQNFFSVPHVIERSLAVNACKSFALTEYAEGYFAKFTEGKDFASFKSEEELYNKINYYMKHEKEREQIAKRAYDKITKKYSNMKMLSDAFKTIEKDKRPLHSKLRVKNMENKPKYLDKNDFKKGISYLNEKVASANYICFKSSGYENIPYRDYFQVYSMDLIKKPISLCCAQLSSNLIGDYAFLDVYYAYTYLDKKYIYKNTDISQFMVRKDFFLANIEKFASLYKGRKAMFINKENTSFLSIPLVVTRKIKTIPLRNIDHILFLSLDLNLLVLKNQKKLLKNSYIYKLLIYSLFINPQILKHVLVNVLPKSKSPKLIKISKFFNKLFN